MSCGAQIESPCFAQNLTAMIGDQVDKGNRLIGRGHLIHDVTRNIAKVVSQIRNGESAFGTDRVQHPQMIARSIARLQQDRSAVRQAAVGGDVAGEAPQIFRRSA